jgi:hypothetical protein
MVGGLYFGSEIQKEKSLQRPTREYKTAIHFIKLQKIKLRKWIPQECRATTHNIYFKQIFAYNAKISTLTERNTSRMKTMEFYGCIEGKTRRVSRSLDFWTLFIVQKSSNSECYTPSSEPFRIYEKGQN